MSDVHPQDKPMFQKFYNCKETLDVIRNHIEANKRGVYLRFGDGDVNLANRESDLHQHANDQLAAEMRAAMGLAETEGVMKCLPLHCKELKTSEPYMEPGNHEASLDWCSRLVSRAQPFWPGKMLKEIYSNIAASYCASHDPQPILKLLLAIRKHPVILVGNKDIPVELQWLLFGISRYFVPTPSSNSYTKIDDIEHQVNALLDTMPHYTIVVTSMGCAGRPLQHRLWSKHPQRKMFLFDFGSLMDALYEADSHAWISISKFNASYFRALLTEEVDKQLKPLWLCYGGRGWIGRQFESYAGQYETIVHSRVRAEDYDAVKREMAALRPDRVISFVGRTSAPIHDNVDTKRVEDKTIDPIDWLEEPGNLKVNLRDNLFGPFVLERVCSELNIHLTYFGTGCIFHSLQPILPGQSPTFFGSSYSTVKGFVDTWMRSVSKSTLNVRIRMPITSNLEDPKSFLYKLLADTTTQIHSTLNSMTVLDDCLPMLISSIRERQKGTLHLVNPGPMTHNEILKLYQQLVNPALTWKQASHEQMDAILSARRSSCVLDTSSNKKIPTLQESIATIFKKSATAKKSMSESKVVKQEAPKVLFIIGSTIVTDNTKPLSYSNVRSIFSAEERFKQTLYSIESIKTRLPNAYVMIADNSETFPDTYMDMLKTKANHVYRCYSPETTSSIYKAKGEAGCLLSALEEVKRLKLSYDYMFKLSGRYYLTDRFDLNNYLNGQDKVGFFKPQNLSIVSTVLYCIPYQMIATFQSWLNNVGTSESMEYYMYEFSKNCVVYVKAQGGEGRVAIDGNLVSY